MNRTFVGLFSFCFDKFPAASQKPNPSWGWISSFCSVLLRSRVIAAADHVRQVSCTYCDGLNVMMIRILCMPNLWIHPRFHYTNNPLIVVYHDTRQDLIARPDWLVASRLISLSLSLSLSLHAATFSLSSWASCIFLSKASRQQLGLVSFVTDRWLMTRHHNSNRVRIPLYFHGTF